MKSCYPNVDQPLHRMAEHLGHHRGLLCHREVAGAGGDNEDRAGLGNGLGLLGRGEVYRTGELVPNHPRKTHCQTSGNGFARTSAEKGPRSGLEALTDGENLLRTLPLAEDNLRMALAQGPMVVDPGERKILERKVPQPFQRRRRSDAARGNLGEQCFELLGCHATWATGSRYSRKIASASPIDSIWKRRWRSALDP
jgi:hypothetical protein